MAVALKVRAWLLKLATFRYCEAAGAPITAAKVSPRGSTATWGPVPPWTEMPKGIGTVFETEKPAALTE